MPAKLSPWANLSGSPARGKKPFFLREILQGKSLPVSRGDWGKKEGKHFFLPAMGLGNLENAVQGFSYRGDRGVEERKEATKKNGKGSENTCLGPRKGQNFRNKELVKKNFIQ